jgi:hypothetical protein
MFGHERHHRGPLLFFNDVKQGKSVHVGQVDIGNYQIEPVVAAQIQRGLCVFGRIALVLFEQKAAERGADFLVFVNN